MSTRLKIKTTEGEIIVALYDETPKHRDNFIKLAKEGYFDGTLFHRVIKDFMIQGGDPNSKDAEPGQMLGTGGPGYTVPAEFVYPKYFHKRGALSAVHSKMIFLICYLLDYQQVHDNTNVSIILLGDKKEPTK
mgnify:CR=1 FL=1